ncbi:MAG: molecular chaperone DnaK, partial [Deltaproteobacteria bacterium]|nr:molecular chaperone DnaK [Deltaproteobacteria bacterium]
FTLITVGDDGDTFDRTAVGDHLLLGGDNIDLTLAKLIESRLGKKLDLLQWHGLVHNCRLAKERMLSDQSIESVPITVAGRGSKLIGGTLKDKLERDEALDIILEGFFPAARRDEHPKKLRSGLHEFGLPYAQDPAITRHAAEFLSRQRVERVDAVLFNGGAMTPTSLRTRVIEQLGAWQDGAPVQLSNQLPELAVGKGAAYYGLVRRGFGARIRGGTPRAFYVGVGPARGEDAGDMAVCLAPKGLEDGSTVELDRDFELVTNRPVSFKLYSSSSRQDQPGELVAVGDGLADMSDDDSDLLELPPIVTVLRAPGRAHAKVHLQVHISELGALEVYCISREEEHDDRWRLTFDMRGGGASSDEEAPQTGELSQEIKDAQELVKDTFQGGSEDGPKRLMKNLEKVLGERRDEWPLTATRALFDAAFEVEDERAKSAEHEARWLHLTGFCLRPGSGAPLDTWRVKQMWRIFNENLHHEKKEQCRLAWWITWRRIAGGLSKGQQQQLYDRLAQLFLPSKHQKKKWHKIKPSKQEAAEMWRTLANLERIDKDNKIILGDELARRMESKKGLSEPLYFWALGRIGARAPLYGPLNTVVPPGRAAKWIEQLLGSDWPEPDKAAFPLAQLGRKTGDRGRDLDDGVRDKLIDRLKGIPGGERTAKLVESVVELEAREERVLLGDSLPAGLRLARDEDVDGDGDSTSAG